MQPSVEKAKYYAENSEHFTHILDSFQYEGNDFLTKFYVKFLYPSIPIKETLQLISKNVEFSNDVMEPA